MRGMNRNAFALLLAAVVGLGACAGDGEPDGMAQNDADEATATPAAAPAPQQQATLAPGVTQAQFDQGRQLFTGAGGCQACHGPTATGTQLAPDLTDDTWINISGPVMEEITQLIRTGVAQPKEHPAPMPPMGGANLNDEQIQALAAYVASIGQGQG